MGKDQELIEAARNGDYSIVQKILNSRAKKGAFSSLRRGPGANAQDANGFSALHHAAVNRHKSIVELLLCHEASTNIVDLQGSSPLHLAAWSGNEEIVKLLLTQGPSVPGSGPNVNLMNKSSETALHMAAQFGHTQVVKLLLHHGADPVITNERHETALDLGAQYGRLETVQLLLKSHPELLAPYSLASSSKQNIIYPHTPLHLASRNGHRSVVSVLVKAGFEVNARTSNGTALHEAALCGKVDVVKTLLESGIDVCVADSQRRTAVDRLSEVGLKTPVAKEIAELIRNSLKNKHIHAHSPLSSQYERTPNINKDGKLVGHDNHSTSSSFSYNSYDTRNSGYSPNISPKANTLNRGCKVRRSLDVSLGKEHDFNKPNSYSQPPKKPPRRNLSASPTHPNMLDLNLSQDSFTFKSLNKSLEEGERWRKSLPSYDNTTSQSIESITIDLSPISKSAKGKGSQYVSVAHIRLRKDKGGESSGDEDLLDGNRNNNYNYNNNNNGPQHNIYGVVKHSKPMQIEVGDEGKGMGRRERLIPRGQKPAIAPKPTIPPKPKTIKEGKVQKRQVPKKVLSPVDVDKEWENITLFMDSFNDGENEYKSTISLTQIGKWLGSIQMMEYETLLVSSGFDDIQFLGGEILDENSLLEIGILNAQHRKIIGSNAFKLDVKWPKITPNYPTSIEEWLKDLHLQQYVETFRKNLYKDPSKLLTLCNDELVTLLEIEPLGHRRRILMAGNKLRKPIPKVGAMERNGSSGGGVNISLDSDYDYDDNDDTLPLRNPNDLVSGVSSALKTAWRHSPDTLIEGSVAYKAIYVGSSQVHEFSTTDAIQKAIQEIRRREISNKPGSYGTSTLVNTQVTLIVSASVVSWYNIKTKNLIREHDIRSIQCTCQASDDLRHLALVTRALDSSGEKCHACHVFCLDSVEIATEAILTLGQAFEVAYQLALGNRSLRNNKSHMRSRSANQLSTKACSSSSSPTSLLKRDKGFSNMTANVHSRSQSDINVGFTPKSNNEDQDESQSQKCQRAESFSYSNNLTRAPIVSKEEL